MPMPVPGSEQVITGLLPRGSEIMMIFTIDTPHVEHASLAQAD